MKRALFFLFVLAFCTQCASDGNSADEGDNMGDSTSMILPSNIPEKGVVTVKDEVDPEAEKRKEKSQLDKETCCADLKNIEKCCCDKVLEKYQAFLKDGNIDGASNMVTVDPHYPECEKQHPYFKDAINEILDKYL